MAQIKINGVIIELARGDIAAQDDMDAVVNAANADLRPGGGVAGALHRAAGPELYEECIPLAPVKPGLAVITPAGRLPNSHVIHCLGPVYGRDHPEEELLASCYRKALELAERAGISSVAFPSISTGAFGYPVRPASQTALKTLIGSASGLKRVKKIRMVLHSAHDLGVYADTLGELASE